MLNSENIFRCREDGLLTTAARPVYEIFGKSFQRQGVPRPFGSAALLVRPDRWQWHRRAPLPPGSLAPDPKCISFLISGASGGRGPPQKHCRTAQECGAGAAPCAGGGGTLLHPCLPPRTTSMALRLCRSRTPAL